MAEPAGTAGPATADGADPAGGAPDEPLEALARAGAERLDPLGFRFLQALAGRRPSHEGLARELLDVRLARAIADCRERCAATAARGAPAAASSPLAPLAAAIGPLPQELAAVRRFGATWSALRLDRRLAEARAGGPDNAGPLNSHLLMLRALEAMREVAPDYLRRFMSYADTLLWLDQVRATPDRPSARRKRATAAGRKPADR